MKIFTIIPATLLMFAPAALGSHGAPEVMTQSPAPEPTSRAAPTDGANTKAVPVPQTSFSPVPAPSPSVAPDFKKMLREFQKAQSSELKALDHRQKLELKELKASQVSRHKEWEKKEQVARHAFFAQHSGWGERSPYLKDFIARREALMKILADEQAERVRAQDARMSSLKEEQATKLKDFKAAIDRKEVPPASLWPQPGQ